MNWVSEKKKKKSFWCSGVGKKNRFFFKFWKLSLKIMEKIIGFGSYCGWVFVLAGIWTV